jgi:hypothetical protein
VIPFSRSIVLTLLFLGLPTAARGQVIFDWPIRTAPQPEAVLTGAGAVFWNPGGLVEEVGTQQEAWILHVDGPDVTGVRGVGASGVVDLPLGIRGSVGYWHLGIHDIPRTTTSPHQEAGEISITEDVALLGLSYSPWARGGVGGALRFSRGAAGSDSRSVVSGEIGIHHYSTFHWRPRLGLVFRGIGGNLQTMGGIEANPTTLASGRVPIRIGYGIQLDDKSGWIDHRLSLRGSWRDQLNLGMGLSYLGGNNGWTPLWMAGVDLGRYSFSILREGLANDFGSVHFFQASIRFP